MATSKRIEQIRKARDRRAKLFALVGLIVLAALLAFEGPKTWKKLHSSKAAPAASVTSASQAGGSGNAVSTAAPSGLQAAAARLADTRIASVPAAGQLGSFGQFKWKDPFVAQAGTDSVATSGAAAAAAAQPSAQPVKPRPAGGSVVVQMGSGKGSAPGADAGIAPGVVLSMNGVAVRVAVGMTFPSGDPIFRLVSFKSGRARIGLTTGTFANGKKTILLVRGRTLTLLNTTAGTKYKLRLVSWSKAA